MLKVDMREVYHLFSRFSDSYTYTYIIIKENQAKHETQPRILFSIM